MSCPMCNPTQQRVVISCAFCRDKDGNAFMETGILSTNSDQTESPDSATSADTISAKTGISTPDSPYLDIVSDLLFMLHGDDEFVDMTPLLQIACMAIELELAERLLDESYNTDAVHTSTATFAN